MRFLYSVCGLTVHSEIELPELFPLAESGGADLSIALGPVPPKLEGATSGGVLYACRPGAFWLELPEVGRFLVEGGSQMTVQPLGTEPRDLRVLLLGSCLGAALLQRGELVLNASTVVIGSEAVVFSGRSAVGKSCLAASLQTFQGQRVVTDELARITLEDGVAYVYPDSNRLKLWAQDALYMGLTLDQLEQIRPGVMHRYSLPIEAADPERVALGAVCGLSLWNREECELSLVPPAERLPLLLRSTYRGRYLEGLGTHPKIFATVTALAQQVSTCILSRPEDPQKVAGVCAWLVGQKF